MVAMFSLGTEIVRENHKFNFISSTKKQTLTKESFNKFKTFLINFTQSLVNQMLYGRLSEFKIETNLSSKNALQYVPEGMQCSLDSYPSSWFEQHERESMTQSSKTTPLVC